jgi:hypothetical protein
MNQSPVAVSSKSAAAKTPMKQRSQGPSSTVVHNRPGAIRTHPTPAPVEYFLQNASAEKKRRVDRDVRAELWQLSV